MCSLKTHIVLRSALELVNASRDIFMFSQVRPLLSLPSEALLASSICLHWDMPHKEHSLLFKGRCISFSLTSMGIMGYSRSYLYSYCCINKLQFLKFKLCNNTKVLSVLLPTNHPTLRYEHFIVQQVPSKIRMMF